MRIEQFAYLADIHQSRSITKTAEKFYISRQVVSHSIRAMESELGFPLLVRSQSTLDFTEAGEAAAQKAAAIVAAFEDFERSMTAFADAPNPARTPAFLNIYAIPRIISTVIPDLSHKYQKHFPAIPLKINSMDSRDIIEKISFDDDTIGLISYLDTAGQVMPIAPFAAPANPNLEIHPFLESEFILCLCKNSRFQQSSYTDEDLKKLPLLSYNMNCYHFFIDSDPTLNITASVNDIHTMALLIKQDIGVGLMTKAEYAYLAAKNAFVQKEIHSKTPENIYFAYVLPHCKTPAPHIAQFIKLLNELFA